MLRVRQEYREQVELVVRQPYVAPAGCLETPQPNVELEAGEAIGADLLQDLWNGLLVPCAPQQSADACEELARRERLRQIVVRRQLEAHYPVGLFLAAGEHDDRHRRLGAQPASDLQAVLAGHAPIDHNQIDDLACHDVRDLATARERRDADIVITEIVADHLAHGRIVVHGENVRGQDLWSFFHS